MIASMWVFYIYLAGIVPTWAITHVFDGYRDAKGYPERDGFNRFLTCFFWPFVLFFHRMINVVQITDWIYKNTVDGLRRLGSKLVRPRK